MTDSTLEATVAENEDAELVCLLICGGAGLEEATVEGAFVVVSSESLALVLAWFSVLSSRSQTERVNANGSTLRPAASASSARRWYTLTAQCTSFEASIHLRQ